MVNVFSAVILLFLLVPTGLSFAQANPKGVKIYSGYLHHYGVQSKDSFWHIFWGKKTPKEGEIDYDSQCSIEFDSPVPFSYRPVTAVPEQLTYFVRFKNGPLSSVANTIEERNAFEKFMIKIHTNDDEEYSIDPDAEGKQVGINDEHHIVDSYLIYLILGQNINHLEIISSSDAKDRYELDKMEVHDDH